MDDKKYTEELAKNISRKLRGKQTALKFDNTPTAGSTNPVTSEGIKEYVDSHGGGGGATYTAGKNIKIDKNNVISATDTTYSAGEGIEISGQHNSISIDENVVAKKIDLPQVIDGYNTWEEINISGWPKSDSFYGDDIWTDGENTYYSNYQKHKIFNKSNLTWENKTWSGDLNYFYGRDIWIDGDNIYYSSGSNQYVLDKSTSTWSTKTWVELTSFSGSNIWTDGTNIYYSSGSNQYVLNKATSTWSQKTWTGLNSFDGNDIWTDGEDIYCNYNNYPYKLKKGISSWYRIYWSNYSGYIYPTYIWTDGKNTYYSNYSAQYIFKKDYLDWIRKEWKDISSFSGENIWTDGENMYYWDGDKWYKLTVGYHAASLLESVAETGSYNDLKDLIKVKENKFTDNWIANDFKKQIHDFSRKWIWSDGSNTYYSYIDQQYILNKYTLRWEEKIWKLPEDLQAIDGSRIWTDGGNIYLYRWVSQYNYTNYILDKSNDTWSEISISGMLNFGDAVKGIWQDGKYSYNSFWHGGRNFNLRFDKDTLTWSAINWSPSTLNTNFSSAYVWTDGENIYYSNGSEHYILQRGTLNWTAVSWYGLTNFIGSWVWTDGENIYYSYDSTHYVLDKATSTWYTKTWTGLNSFTGNNIWTDGENIYMANDYVVTTSPNYQIETVKHDLKECEKVAETGNYYDLKNIPKAITKIVTVASEDWEYTETYLTYPYRVSVYYDVNNIDNKTFIVNFELNDALSGNYAPICESSGNDLYIYCMQPPVGNITVYIKEVL